MEAVGHGRAAIGGPQTLRGITGINAGEANVELDANEVRLVASITVEAVRQLGLTQGDNVTAVVTASDMMIVSG